MRVSLRFFVLSNISQVKLPILWHPFILTYYHWKKIKTLVLLFLRLGISSFTMFPRVFTYSPVKHWQTDEDDVATEKLLGHSLNPQIHHKISRYWSFWIHHCQWPYFIHGALLSVSILFFCLWIRARAQIPKFAVYCKSCFASGPKGDQLKSDFYSSRQCRCGVL